MIKNMKPQNSLASSTAVDVLDNILFTLGNDRDGVMVLRSSTLGADTGLTDVLEGTPVTPAISANSIIISNITDDGDILMATSDGGTSKAFLHMDADVNVLYLVAPTGGIMLQLAADAPAPDQGGVHIWEGSAGSLTAGSDAMLILESDGAIALETLQPDGGSGAFWYARATTAGRLGYMGYFSTATPYWEWGAKNAAQLQLSDSGFTFVKLTTITLPDTSAINTGVGDNDYYTLGADDTGVGIVEVARAQGAADPYFATGGSQEWKFYNSGIATAVFGDQTAAMNGLFVDIDTGGATGWGSGNVVAGRFKVDVDGSGTVADATAVWAGLTFDGSFSGVGLTTAINAEVSIIRTDTAPNSILYLQSLPGASASCGIMPFIVFSETRGGGATGCKYLFELGHAPASTTVTTGDNSTTTMIRTGGHATTNISNKQGIQIVLNGSEYYIPLIATGDWSDDGV